MNIKTLKHLVLAAGLSLAGATSARAVAVDAPELETPKIVNATWCSLGTSITWYNNNVGESGGRFTKGYQTRVQEQFKFAGFLNKGVNGGCVASAVGAVPSQAYDLYTIEHGVNDWGHNVDPGTMDDYNNNTQNGTFAADYRRVIDNIRNVNPNAKIILCTPRKAYGFGTYLPATCDAQQPNGYYLEDYVDIVNGIAAKEGFPVADFYATCGEQAELADLSIDVALHPNDAGYQKMANELVKKLVALYPDAEDYVEPDPVVLEGVQRIDSELKTVPFMESKLLFKDVQLADVIGLQATACVTLGYCHSFDQVPVDTIYADGTMGGAGFYFLDRTDTRMTVQVQAKDHRGYMGCFFLELTQNGDDIHGQVTGIKYFEHGQLGWDGREHNNSNSNRYYLDTEDETDALYNTIVFEMSLRDLKLLRMGEVTKGGFVFDGFLTKQDQVVVAGLTSDLSQFSVLSSDITGSAVPNSPFPCKTCFESHDYVNNTYTCQLQSLSPNDQCLRVFGVKFTQAANGDVLAKIEWVRYKLNAEADNVDLTVQGNYSGTQNSIATSMGGSGYGVFNLVMGNGYETAALESAPLETAWEGLTKKSRALLTTVPYQKMTRLFANVRLADVVGIEATSCVTLGYTNPFIKKTLSTIYEGVPTTEMNNYDYDGIYHVRRMVGGDAGTRLSFQIEAKDNLRGNGGALLGGMTVNLVQVGPDVYGEVSNIRYYYQTGKNYGVDCEASKGSNYSTKYYYDNEDETVNDDIVFKLSLRDLKLVSKRIATPRTDAMRFDGCLSAVDQVVVPELATDLSDFSIISAHMGGSYIGENPFPCMVCFEAHDTVANTYSCQLQWRSRDGTLRSVFVTCSQDPDTGDVLAKIDKVRYDSKKIGTDISDSTHTEIPIADSYTSAGYTVGELIFANGEAEQPLETDYDGYTALVSSEVNTVPYKKRALLFRNTRLADVVRLRMASCVVFSNNKFVPQTASKVYAEGAEGAKGDGIYFLSRRGDRMVFQVQTKDHVNYNKELLGDMFVELVQIGPDIYGRVTELKYLASNAYGVDGGRIDSSNTTVYYTDEQDETAVAGDAAGVMRFSLRSMKLVVKSDVPPVVEPLIVPFDGCLTTTPKLLVSGFNGDLSSVHLLSGMIGCGWGDGTPYEGWAYLENYDVASNTYTCQLQSKLADTYLRSSLITLTQDWKGDVYVQASWIRWINNAAYGTDMRAGASDGCAPNGSYTDPGYAVGDLKVGFGGATLPGSPLLLVPTISDSAEIIIHGFKSDLSNFHALGCNLSGGYIGPKVTPGILECRPYFERYDAATDTYTCQLQADKIDYGGGDTYVRGIGIEVKRNPVTHDVTLKATWHGHSISGATVGTDMSSAHTNMNPPNYVFREFLFSVEEGRILPPLESAHAEQTVSVPCLVKTVPYQTYTKLFEGVSLADVADLGATACVTLGYGNSFVKKQVVASTKTADGFYFIERTAYGDAAHMTFQVQAKDNSGYTCAMLVDLFQVGADIYGKVSQAEYMNKDAFGTDCRTRGTAYSIRYYTDDEDETSDPDKKYVYEASLRDLTLTVLSPTSFGGADWIGGAEGDWNDPDNWSCGHAPTASDDVRIYNGGASVAITLPAGATAKSIVIRTDTTLTGAGTFADVAIRPMATLTLNLTGDSTIKNVTGGTLVKDGAAALEAKDGANGSTLSGTKVIINEGRIRFNSGHLTDPSFVIGENGQLENYGWFYIYGTLTIKNETDKEIFTNYGAGSGDDIRNAYIRGNPKIVKNGTGILTLSAALENQSADIVINEGRLYFGANRNVTYAGLISGAGAAGLNTRETTATITFNHDNTFTGGFYVIRGVAKASGTAQVASFGPYSTDPAKTSNIYVMQEGTLDINNAQDRTYNIYTEGTLQSSTARDPNCRQIADIVLTGDTTVQKQRFGLLGPSYGPTRLTLDDHTLTVNMDSDNGFYIGNTTVSGTGTIDVKAGYLRVAQKPSEARDATIIIRSGAKLALPYALTVKNLVLEAGALFDGTAMLTVTGEYTPGAAPVNLTLADTATIRFPAGTNAGVSLPLCTGTLTVGEGFRTKGASFYVGDELVTGDLIITDKQIRYQRPGLIIRFGK